MKAFQDATLSVQVLGKIQRRDAAKFVPITQANVEHDDSDEFTRMVERMEQENFVFGNSGSLQKIVTHLCCLP